MLEPANHTEKIFPLLFHRSVLTTLNVLSTNVLGEETAERKKQSNKRHEEKTSRAVQI